MSCHAALVLASFLFPVYFSEALGLGALQIGLMLSIIPLIEGMTIFLMLKLKTSIRTIAIFLSYP